MENRSVYPVNLELRQEGGQPVIAGSFPYGSTATVSDRGRVRKERFEPHAFDFVLQESELHREVNFLYGHNPNTPLASRQAGTFSLEDTATALSFQATLPVQGEQPSWVQDFLLAHRAGLVREYLPVSRTSLQCSVPS